MDERKFTVKIELEENLDDELHQDINLKSEMEGDLPIKSEIFLNAVNDYDLQDFEHVLINSLPIKEEPNVDEIEVKYFEEAKNYVQDNIQNYEAQPTHSLDPLRIEKEPDKSPSRHISNQCGSSLEKCKHSCGKAFLKQAEKFGAFVRSACKEEACPKLALRRGPKCSPPRSKYLMPEEDERYNMEGQTSQYYEYLLTGKDAKESISIILPPSHFKSEEHTSHSSVKSHSSSKAASYYNIVEGIEKRSTERMKISRSMAREDDDGYRLDIYWQWRICNCLLPLGYHIELYYHCTDKKLSRKERLEKKREESKIRQERIRNNKEQHRQLNSVNFTVNFILTLTFKLDFCRGSSCRKSEG
uniref:Uncharacterized protein n=1 Tax=Timema bartmani TaxID=61472 RepID=A0A7R9EM24_9NEOP|nr:unnamed protein product [Timema bartmani]